MRVCRGGRHGLIPTGPFGFSGNSAPSVPVCPGGPGRIAARAGGGQSNRARRGQHRQDRAVPGEGALHDDLARMAHEAQAFDRHHAEVQAERRRAPARAGRGLVTDPLRGAAAERARAPVDRGQQHHARLQHGADIGIGRLDSAPLRHQLELAPAHEARRRHRLPHRVNVDKRVAAGIEPDRSAADRHDDHPRAGRHHRERPPAGQKVRIKRGVGIVNAARDGRAGANSGGPRDLGQDRPEPRGTGTRRRQQVADCQPVDERRKRARARVPQIGMRA